MFFFINAFINIEARFIFVISLSCREQITPVLAIRRPHWSESQAEPEEPLYRHFRLKPAVTNRQFKVIGNIVAQTRENSFICIFTIQTVQIYGTIKPWVRIILIHFHNICQSVYPPMLLKVMLLILIEKSNQTTQSVFLWRANSQLMTSLFVTVIIGEISTTHNSSSNITSIEIIRNKHIRCSTRSTIGKVQISVITCGIGSVIPVGVIAVIK